MLIVLTILITINIAHAAIELNPLREEYSPGETVNLGGTYVAASEGIFTIEQTLTKGSATIASHQESTRGIAFPIQIPQLINPDNTGTYRYSVKITDASGNIIEENSVEFRVERPSGTFDGPEDNIFGEEEADPCAGKCSDSDGNSANELQTRGTVTYLRPFGDSMREDYRLDSCIGTDRISEAFCDEECGSFSDSFDCPGNHVCSPGHILRFNSEDNQYGAACTESFDNIVIKINENTVAAEPDNILPISENSLVLSVEIDGEQPSALNLAITPKLTRQRFMVDMTYDGNKWVGEFLAEHLGSGFYDVLVAANYLENNKVRVNTREVADFQIFKPYKMLFVAANWESGTQTFIEEVQGQFDSFVESYPIKDCREQAQMFILTPDQLNCNINFGSSISSGGELATISLLGCIFQSKNNFPDILNPEISRQLDLTQDANNFQVVIGLVDKDPYPCVGGFFADYDTVFVQKGDKDILSHEIGHIFSLREEYIYSPNRDSTPWNLASGSPNDLSAEYGCDPSSGGNCCGPLGACATPEGQAQCTERKEKMLSGNYKCGDNPENPCWKQPDSYCGCNDFPACCMGNLNRFDSNNIGRSIMSHGGAQAPQGFSEPAWQHLLKQPEFQCIS